MDPRIGSSDYQKYVKTYAELEKQSHELYAEKKEKLLKTNPLEGTGEERKIPGVVVEALKEFVKASEGPLAKIREKQVKLLKQAEEKGFDDVAIEAIKMEGTRLGHQLSKPVK